MRTLVTLFSISMVAMCARADGKAPDDTVHAFYAWALAHPANALPSPEQRTELASLLTPDTLRLLDDALRTEAECIADTSPGDKPDVLEGDLFVGTYEGATEVAYGESVRQGDSILVESTLVHVDPSLWSLRGRQVVGFPLPLKALSRLRTRVFRFIACPYHDGRNALDRQDQTLS